MPSIMKASPIPHYFNIFPTGNIPVPVCIGDLPMSNYIVSPEILTEDVASFLEANPLLPGAIIVRNGKADGMISRHKMFERLGHRYGVELFLRKPISEMSRELEVETFALKSHLTINMAVRLALSRVQKRIYDPVIVEFENGNLGLLDMYILLLSQSQLSQNLSGIVSSLNAIEMMIATDQSNPTSTLELIMEDLAKVVPSHHAKIVLQPGGQSSFIHHFILNQNEPLERNNVYKSALVMNQPMALEDVRIVPAWSNWDTPINTRSWLGAPFTGSYGTAGLISLARTTLSPFTNHEKETSLVFARYLGKLFDSAIRQSRHRQALEKKYSIW